MTDIDATTNAVVTGAASGIGLSFARALVARGAAVVLADRDEQALAAAAEALVAGGARVRTVVTDVTEPASVDELSARAGEWHGPTHLLVGNAGVLRPGLAYDAPAEDLRAVLAVNVEGVMNGHRAFVPRMLKHGEPAHVLNVASVAGVIITGAMTPYVVSKHAVLALTECLAADLEGTTVGVTALCPGGTSSEIYRSERTRRATGAIAGAARTEEVFAAWSAEGRADVYTPDEVVTCGLAAVEAGERYAIVFRAEQRAMARSRFAGIEAAMARRERDETEAEAAEAAG